MARACSTCEHPDRASIEIGLANGVALRVLGLRYGLDPSQLSRHRTKHMQVDLLDRLRVRGSRSDKELAEFRDQESKGLLDHLVWSRGRMYANADRCIAIGDEAGERAAIAEAGRASERIGRLLGELGAHISITNNTLNLYQSPEWHLIRSALVRELRPYPEAWAAAVRAIEAGEAAVVRPPIDVPRLVNADG